MCHPHCRPCTACFDASMFRPHSLRVASSTFNGSGHLDSGDCVVLWAQKADVLTCRGILIVGYNAPATFAYWSEGLSPLFKETTLGALPHQAKPPCVARLGPHVQHLCSCILRLQAIASIIAMHGYMHWAEQQASGRCLVLRM